MREPDEYAALKAEYAERFMDEAAGAASQLRTYDVLIADVERDCSGVGGVSYDKVGSNPNAYVDNVHDQAMRVASSLQRWKDGRKAAYAVVAAAVRSISCMQDAKRRQILELRYLDGFTWKQVGNAVGLSESHVKHLHPHALVDLYDYIPTKFKIPAYDARFESD